jgi:metal-responsive CopG/Arc/MetJ family transcriptional regulator
MTVKVVVSLPDALLAELDRIAQEEQRSRSAVLQAALRLYIEMRRSTKRPGDDPEVRAAIAIQDALSQKSPGTGQDSTFDIRRQREAR